MQTTLKLSVEETRQAVQEFITKKGINVAVKSVESKDDGFEVVGDLVQKQPIVRQKKPQVAAAPIAKKA